MTEETCRKESKFYQRLFDGDTSVMNLVKLFMIKDATYGDNHTINVTR